MKKSRWRLILSSKFFLKGGGKMSLEEKESALKRELKKRKNKKQIVLDQKQAETILDCIKCKIKESEDFYEISDLEDFYWNFIELWTEEAEEVEND